MDNEERIINATEEVVDQIDQYAALESFLIEGQSFGGNIISGMREFKSVKEFLDLPFGDPKEDDLKKIFAASIIVADEKGILPFSLPSKIPSVIATLCDDSLTRLKVHYQVGEGIIEAEEGQQILKDKFYAKFIVPVKLLIREKGPKALMTAINIIESVSNFCFPEYSYYWEFVKQVAPIVTPAIISSINKGIERGYNFVKQKASNAITKIAGFFHKNNKKTVTA